MLVCFGSGSGSVIVAVVVVVAAVCFVRGLILENAVTGTMTCVTVFITIVTHRLQGDIRISSGGIGVAGRWDSRIHH